MLVTTSLLFVLFRGRSAFRGPTLDFVKKDAKYTNAGGGSLPESFLSSVIDGGMGWRSLSAHFSERNDKAGIHVGVEQMYAERSANQIFNQHELQHLTIVEQGLPLHK